MESSIQKPNRGRSPFFKIIEQAENVEIMEVPFRDRTYVIHSMEEALKNFDSEDRGSRFFLVTVKRGVADRGSKSGIRFSGAHSTGIESFESSYVLECADILLENREIVLARNVYSYCLKKDLGNANALRGLGICLFELGEHFAAKRCFNALWDLHAREEALFWIGQTHLIEGNDRAAIEIFEKIKNPNSLSSAEQFIYFKDLGNAHTRLGNFDPALRAYQGAERMQPQSDVIYVNLGTMECQRQNWGAAENYFVRAIEINPKNSKARCGIGLVHRANDHLQEAMDAFEKSLDLDSQNWVALSALITLGSSGTTRTIEGRLVEFLKHQPKNAHVSYSLANFYFRLGNWGACRRQIENTLAIDPDYSKAKQLREEFAQITGGL